MAVRLQAGDRHRSWREGALSEGASWLQIWSPARCQAWSHSLLPSLPTPASLTGLLRGGPQVQQQLTPRIYIHYLHGPSGSPGFPFSPGPGVPGPRQAIQPHRWGEGGAPGGGERLPPTTPHLQADLDTKPADPWEGGPASEGEVSARGFPAKLIKKVTPGLALCQAPHMGPICMKARSRKQRRKVINLPYAQC